MRRAGVLLFALLALGSTSCMRLLFPDYECPDPECVPATWQCDGNSTEVCVLEPFFGCLTWVTDENCEDWGAVCVDAECVCPPGMLNCPPDAHCTDTSSDPVNCGGCGIVCPAGCLHGQCLTPQEPLASVP